MNIKIKKIILLVAVSAILMSIVGAATYAFLSIAGRTRNVITTGRIDISILEQQISNGEYIPYPDTPIDIMPSSTVSKIVSVQCNESEAYVRMKYSVLIKDSQGNSLDLEPEIIEMEPTGTNNGWIDGGDGWFYYDSVLSSGDITTPLFEQIVCSSATSNEYQNTTVIVRIHAQSVQAKNNSAPNGDVTAVKGWPRA